MEEAMNAEGSDIPVYAMPIYLSETTTTSSAPDRPVRIRVQDGSDDEKWREFPSLLHLEILQSLQEPMDGSDDEQNETTLGDLYAVFTSAELNDDSTIKWKDVVEALKWLFANNYIYFNTIDDDVDPAEALSGLAEIVDLR